jgi:outer membrane protein OmpA-like peptidoglycan-associated protein
MALVPPQWVCLFDQDSAELLPSCQEQLRALIVTRPARFWDVIPVTVQGYADTSEARTPEGRQRLSERRAQAVARFLTLSGIPDHLVRAQGRGALGPEPRSRRVEVTMEG